MLREKLANDISKLAMIKQAITVDAAFRALRNTAAKGENVASIPIKKWHRIINSMKNKSPENAARINQISEAFPNIEGTYSDEFFPKVREFLKGNIDSAGKIEGGGLSQTYIDRHIRRMITPTAEASKALEGFGSNDKYLRDKITKYTPAERSIEEMLKKDPLKPNWVEGSPSVEHLTAQQTALRQKALEHVKGLTAAGNEFNTGMQGITSRLENIPDIAQGRDLASAIKKRLGFGSPQKAIESGRMY